MKINISEESVICRGKRYEDSFWGEYQFPKISRLEDGTFAVTVHEADDTPLELGGAERSYLSPDGGKSWQKEEKGIVEGVLLPNGDRLYPVYKKPVDVGDRKFSDARTLNKILPGEKIAGAEDEVNFPDYLGREAASFWNGNFTYTYLLDMLPEDIKSRAGFYFNRKKKGESQYKEEKSKLSWRNQTMDVFDSGKSYTVGGGNVVLPFSVYHSEYNSVVVDNEGNLWLAEYRLHSASPISGGYINTSAVFVFNSRDNGYSWSLAGYIPYVPDVDEYFYAYQCDGFTEPALQILSDGTFVMLLRTCGVFHGGPEWGPCYITKSFDKGKTWTKPKRFADIGALPRLLRLKSGIVLAAITRPGIFITAADEKDIDKWSSYSEVMTAENRCSLMNNPPERPHFHQWAGSCCNVSLCAIDEKSALIVYSDFFYPDEEGVKRKTVLAKKITVEI